MSARRLLAPLVCCVAAGCNFDARGLGTSTEVDLGTASSSGEPPASTGTSSSTGAPDPDTGESSSSGEPPCSDGCPPTPGWTVTPAGQGHAMVVDPAGDVIVVGEQVQLDDAAQRDVWVARFAGADGSTVWEQRHAGGQKLADFARAVALTADGTIVAAGGSQEVQARRMDVWVGWLSPAGELLTSTNLATTDWDGTDPKLDEWAGALALDAEGDLVVVGSRCHVPCKVPDAWIGRFTGEGKPIWDEPMLWCGQGSLDAVVVRDADLFAVGTDGYEASQLPWRSLVRRIDSSGGGTWSALPEAQAEALDFAATATSLAADGGLWVVGRELASGADGGFLRLYRPDRGDTPIQELRGEALGGELTAISLVDGEPVVAGADGRGTARHLWLGRYTAALEPVWRIDEPPEAASAARGLGSGPDGALLVLGVREGAGSWLRQYLPAG